MKRRDTTYIHIRLKILQVPFAKISVEDRAQDLLDRFPVEVVVQDPCVRLSVQGAYRASPNKIFVRDLKISTLFKQSFNDLGARPPLSSPGLCTRSPKEVSWQDLCTRSQKEFCWQDLCKRPLGKISVQISRRGLLARPLGQDLYKRYLGKISFWDLRTSSL